MPRISLALTAAAGLALAGMSLPAAAGDRHIDFSLSFGFPAPPPPAVVYYPPPVYAYPAPVYVPRPYYRYYRYRPGYYADQIYYRDYERERPRFRHREDDDDD